VRLLPYSLRSFRRELRSGDLPTLALALVLGVAVMTAVGTLVNRVTLALTQSAGEIIGGDLGVAGRTAIPAEWQTEAERRGLATARIVIFASVVFHGEASQLAEIKAVDAKYPLRGEMVLAEDMGGMNLRRGSAPAAGTAYADARLLDALGLVPGGSLEFGDRMLELPARLHTEPDASGEMFQLAPRLLVNLADVEDSGLLAPGSRAAHRLMFAGEPSAVDDFRQWLAPRMDGFRFVSVADAQRAVRGAFERAQRFLSLAALLAVLLAGVATALAANRFALRQIDNVAVLRCLGAPQPQILGALTLQLLMLAVPACLLGVLIGLGVQAALVEALGSLLPQRLPLPQAQPALSGAAIGLVMLLGFGLPPLLRLRGVPPMRVLNRSFAALPRMPALISVAAVAGACTLVALATRDVRLALYVMAGLAALGVVSWIVGFAALWVARRLQSRLRGAWRLGMAALSRRRALSVVQLTGLALSLCALLLLSAIGPALLTQWRAQLAPDTPNWFLLNVQQHQAESVLDGLRRAGVAEPRLEPFATGRLLAINGVAPRAEDFTDPRAGAWINGPLNMSWREDFPPANRLTAGQFWKPDSAVDEVSVERMWVDMFGIALGDTLSIGIGDRSYDLKVTSLREADWDSFRVNFFLLLNANAMQDAPHNLISSFHLPAGQASALQALTRTHPNVSLIDIDAILTRVREVMERVAEAVQLVLAFSLAAGVLVLVAALQATRSERRYESTVLRTLGARQSQIRGAVLAEFAAIGGLAGALAAIGAAMTGQILAQRAFDMGLDMPWLALAAGALTGMLLAMLAGWLGTRSVVATPPALSLRSEYQ
jgi:putative ABC transport system permease protein